VRGGGSVALRAGASTNLSRLAIFVLSRDVLSRALDAVASAGLEAVVLDDGADRGRGPRRAAVSVATMHQANGLEFPAVAVMACDDDVLPLAARLAAVADMTELKEVHDAERHLLYVAVTGARDELWVCGVGPGSEYLADLL
jgi:superfamily I DNA/RNA helicase